MTQATTAASRRRIVVRRIRCAVALAVAGCATPKPPPRCIDAGSGAVAAPAEALAQMIPHEAPSGKASYDLPQRLAHQGVDEYEAGRCNEAERTYREAVARVPEPTYFFNLCVVLYREGKLDLALTACSAIPAQHPTPELLDRTRRAIDAIHREGDRRGILVQPVR